MGSSKLGDVWSEHIHPDDLTRFRSAWLAASLPGATFCEEVRMRDGQGNYQWFLSRALAAHDAKGNLIRWFGTNTVRFCLLLIRILIINVILECGCTKKEFGREN